MINIFLILMLLFIIVIVLLLIKEINIFSKILLLNSLTNIVSLFICFLGSFKMNNSYLDIALIYFLLSFIASSAYLKYFMGQPK
ncbi:monovalent cation/H+ antiporter complex subunit F [Candidatus Tisiphia endosymbiont of Nemotelus uliginosus]|uniref:monovalent cation/H+ antiporter complex subunit F n=1 Tax=Candidatus Tisiphia endosymbiont of Nemotelus uliginosus TaxID=3077926 RepID=UPI0035C8F92F